MKKTNNDYIIPVLVLLAVPIFLVLTKLISNLIQILFNADSMDANVLSASLLVLSIVASIGLIATKRL